MPKMEEVICNGCKNPFLKEKKKVTYFKKKNPNWNFYCTNDCYKSYLTNSMEVECQSCFKKIKKRKSELNKNKSGKYYCSKSCACRENNKNRDYKTHTNYNNGGSTYRKRALDYYGSECRICGYDIEEVLEVHHKDENRENNDIENLDVLCPTHHTEYHCGIRKY